MGKMITCTSEQPHSNALTRGKQYELLAERNGNVRVRGDNERTRWYSSLRFDLDGNPAPRLSRWKFDDPRDELTETLIEMTMQFDDGMYRWSLIATPATLKNFLENRDMEPGIWASHMIVIRSLNPADVSLVLSQLDRAGELLDASKLIDYEEGQSPDHDGSSYIWYVVGLTKTAL